MDLIVYWLNGQIIVLHIHFLPILEHSVRKLYYGYNWTSSDDVTKRISGNYFSDDTNDDIILKKRLVDNRYLIIKVNDAIFLTRNRDARYHAL